jgi:hypothetical protein
MAHHLKLNDDDDKFIQVPEDGLLVFAGASGVETWIERDHDTTVRIVIKAVGVATAEGGALEVAIDLGDARAKGQDGPAPLDTRLRASISVQVVVKAGQRLPFKAYPTATNVHVLRTVVLTADLKTVAPDPEPAHEARPEPQHA